MFTFKKPAHNATKILKRFAFTPTEVILSFSNLRLGCFDPSLKFKILGKIYDETYRYDMFAGKWISSMKVWYVDYEDLRVQGMRSAILEQAYITSVMDGIVEDTKTSLRSFIGDK